MGEIVGDHDIFIASLLELLNIRFGPSEPGYEDVSGVAEVAALQQKFTVFSEAHTFRESVALLGLAGHWNWTLKQRWYRLLDSLASCPSDQPGQNGNQRIVAALKDNLASKQPKPVHFTAHLSTENPGVLVKQDEQAIFYMRSRFITISLPMRARR
jgi:hypothetical protein